MSRVLFIRHAETEMAGRFCGHSDPELNPAGRARLGPLVEMLAGQAIDRVYSSDLVRARSTAQAIAGARGIPLELRPALRECYFGAWEGLHWDQIEEMDPEYARQWMEAHPHLPAPLGEDFAAFEARVLEEVNRILDTNGGPIAVVTHAGVLRVILKRFCGCSEPQAWQQTQSYCCIVRYEFEAIGETQ
jgi:broad specificity phosphatase PhoE